MNILLEIDKKWALKILTMLWSRYLEIIKQEYYKQENSNNIVVIVFLNDLHYSLNIQFYDFML